MCLRIMRASGDQCDDALTEIYYAALSTQHGRIAYHMLLSGELRRFISYICSWCLCTSTVPKPCQEIHVPCSFK
jgi:hypothetical protein